MVCMTYSMTYMTYSKRLQMPRELITQWPVVSQYHLANKKPVVTQPFLPPFQLASPNVQSTEVGKVFEKTFISDNCKFWSPNPSFGHPTLPDQINWPLLVPSVHCPLKSKTEMKVLINHCIMQLLSTRTTEQVKQRPEISQCLLQSSILPGSSK